MTIKKLLGSFAAAGLLFVALGGYAMADESKGEEAPPVDTAPPPADEGGGEAGEEAADE